MGDMLNIGLLVDSLDTHQTFYIVKGAKLAAKELGANLFLLPGRYIEPNVLDSRFMAYNYQFNTLFALAGVVQFDIIIVLLGSIASTQNELQKQAFLEQYPNVPIVTLCCELDAYSSVCPDNTTGLTAVIEHLIDEHHAEKIGMVAGPATNQDSLERVQAFCKVLQKRGLPLGEQQLVHGNFTSHCKRAVEKLLDNNPDLDAIVFANDNMAMAGYKVLAERGLRVGQDILVTGFDNDVFAPTLEPSLTTVVANGVDMGYEAVMAGKRYLETGNVEHLHTTNQPIFRKSCGCLFVEGQKLVSQYFETDRKEADDWEIFGNYFFGNSTSARLDEDNQSIVQKFGECVRVLDHMGRHVRENGSIDTQDMLKIYDNIRDLFSMGETMTVVSERMINVFRLLHRRFEEEMLEKADQAVISDIFYNIYKMNAEYSVRRYARTLRHMEHYERKVNTFSNTVLELARTDIDCYRQIFDYLRSIRVENAVVFTYEKPISHIDGNVWNVPEDVYLTAFDTEHGMICYADDRKKLATKEIFDNEHYRFLPNGTRLLMPIFAGEMQYGFLIFELDAKYYDYVVRINSQINDAFDMLYKREKSQDAAEGEIISLWTPTHELNKENMDALTLIFNKNGFLKEMHYLLEQRDLQGLPAIMIFIEIADWADIVEEHGEENRDRILSTTAFTLLESFGKYGIVSRYDENRFVAVLPMSKGVFERKLLPQLENLDYKVQRAANLEADIEFDIGYLKFIIERNEDFSEYLERGEEILDNLRRERMKYS